MSEESQLEGWGRLRAAVGPDEPHAVDLWTLGEYAARRERDSEAAARAAFPAVAAHLAEGCAACAVDLAELAAFLRREAKLRRALERQATFERPPGADEPRARALGLRGYAQPRWDAETLAEAAELDREFARRLREAEGEGR